MTYISKETALREYKEAKKNYLENMTNDNWVKFCDAKTTCMKLGIRIQEVQTMKKYIKFDNINDVNKAITSIWTNSDSINELKITCVMFLRFNNFIIGKSLKYQ